MGCGPSKLMPVEYSIDRDRRLVISTARGAVTLAEVKSHQERLLSDPGFDPAFDQLVDASQMRELLVPAGEGFKLASRSVFAETSRRAVVMKRGGIWQSIG